MIMDDALRGQLFRQLAQLESAGIASDQAVGIVNLADRAAQKLLRRLASAVKSGSALSEAALRLGLISDAESAVLGAGESSGKSGLVMVRLADLCEQRASRIRVIKSRLVLPAAMIVLAHFIAPVPALIGGAIDLADYLWFSVGGLLRLALIVYGLIQLPGWLTRGFLKPLGLANWIYRLQTGAPVVGPFFVRLQFNRFCEFLGLLLAAGLSAAQAVPLAVSAIENPLLRDQFGDIPTALARGESLADALGNLAVVDRSIIHVLRSGEASGRVAESLAQHTVAEAENLNIHVNGLVEWLPRLLYFAVIGWLGYNVVGDQLTIMGE